MWNKWPHGYNLNIKGLGPLLLDKKIFKVFPLYEKQVTPGEGRGHIWIQGYNLNNLGRGRLDDATYQISFRQEEF